MTADDRFTSVEVKSARYFTCPNGCADRFEFEHLVGLGCAHQPPQPAGPWSCKGCGGRWFLRVYYDGRVEVQRASQDYKRQWVVLEIKAAKSIRFLILDRYLTSSDDEHQSIEHARYYENTCPTNWLRNVDEVAVDGDIDSHKFVRVVNALPAHCESGIYMEPAGWEKP